MISLRIECADYDIENVAKCLESLGSYKIWVYGDKAYAVFKVKSISALRVLGRRLKSRKIQFKVLKIEKLPWWKVI